jgi:hypothetical protein
MIDRRVRRPLRHGPEQSFVPASRQGAIYPGIGAALAFVLALALIGRGLTLGVSFAALLCYVVAVVLLAGGALAAYWAWACLTLQYELGQGVFAVRWGLARYEAPVAGFERVVRGRTAGAPPVAGLEWPGCHVGAARITNVGPVRMVSLHRAPADVLYLAAPAGSREPGFGISVADPAAFIRALQGQFDLTAPIDGPRVDLHPALATLSWRDRPVQRLLVAALAGAVIATAIVFSRYAGFPDQIVLRFPGEARIGPRTAMLGIPALAWGFLVINGVLGVVLARRRRPAAFTVLAGLAFLEVLLVVAAITAA